MSTRMLLRAATTACIGLITLAMLPAKAATSFTILFGGVPQYGITREEFTRGRCDPAFTASKLNGVDAYVLDVSPWAGGSLRMYWDSPVRTAAGATAELFTSACQSTPNPSLYTPTPGWWTVSVPPGSKWLVVEPNNAVSPTFSIP